MTPVERLVRAQIAARGPMSVAEYMALALGHPEHGYYATRDPLGAAGDFTTAPEVSQMFGEMIGLWLADRLTGLGAEPVLVELGPGRGTLMADALRVAAPLRRLPLWLVETSPALRAIQAERLPHARHAARLSDVPEGRPILLVANELLDALPVRQYLADAQGWREVQVGLEGDRLAFGLSGPLPGPAPAAPGEWAERSAAADALADEIARRLRTAGGWALIVDYGYRAEDRPPGPTLQAVRDHARADPLASPGEADLTWLVDFDALAGRLAPAWVADQGAFLTALGIGRRAEQLARAAPGSADTVADALERLTGAAAMGRLFKVLAAGPPGATAPPGFDPFPPGARA